MSAVVDKVRTFATSLLPSGWRSATLEGLVGLDGIFVDGDWVETKDQDPEGDVRLIQLADVGDGEYRDRSERFLTSAKARKLNCTFLERGDLLVARMPDPLGRACIFPGDRKLAVTVVDVAVVRPRNRDVNVRWLMHCINGPQFRRAVATLQSGSTRQRISRKNLAKIVFPLPPRRVQDDAVAEIEKQFSRLDDAIANLRRVGANLGNYEAAVLKAAVEGRLVPTEAELASREDRGYETGQQLLKRVLEQRRPLLARGAKKHFQAPNGESLPELREGWAWCSVSQICEVASGNTPAGILHAVRPDGDLPWFKVGDMNHAENQRFMRRSEAWLTNADVKALNLRIFPPKTVLFPKRGGAIATNKKRLLERSACADLNVMGITPEGDIAPYFFVWFDGIDLSKLSDGSNVPQINHNDIDPLSVPLPPLHEQGRIVAEVARLRTTASEVRAESDLNLARAHALRQTILATALATPRAGK